MKEERRTYKKNTFDHWQKFFTHLKLHNIKLNSKVSNVSENVFEICQVVLLLLNFAEFLSKKTVFFVIIV